MPHGCERGKAFCSVLQTDIKFLVGFSAAKRKSYCFCSDFFFFDFFALSSAKKLFFLSGFFFFFFLFFSTRHIGFVQVLFSTPL